MQFSHPLSRELKIKLFVNGTIFLKKTLFCSTQGQSKLINCVKINSIYRLTIPLPKQRVMDVITFIFKRLIDKQKTKVQKIFDRLRKKRDEIEMR